MAAELPEVLPGLVHRAGFHSRRLPFRCSPTKYSTPTPITRRCLSSGAVNLSPMSRNDLTPKRGVLHRPVQFAQYLSIRYTERLAEAGIATSVGSRGDSYDNAMAESMNALYKAELVYRRGPWRRSSDLALTTLEWVDWFNNRSLFGALGYVPPAEYEASSYAAPLPVGVLDSKI